MLYRRKKTCSPSKLLDELPDSPSRTPTTLTSLSFSSQEFPISARHTPLSTRVPDTDQPNAVKNFHSHYLDLGLWPKHRVAELKTKYREEKAKRELYEMETIRLKAELKNASELPCANCVKERERHQVTKQALEEAISLSNLLLREVAALDTAIRQIDSQRSSLTSRSVIHKR